MFIYINNFLCKGLIFLHVRLWGPFLNLSVSYSFFLSIYHRLDAFLSRSILSHFFVMLFLSFSLSLSFPPKVPHLMQIYGRFRPCFNRFDVFFLFKNQSRLLVTYSYNKKSLSNGRHLPVSFSHSHLW